MRIAMAVVVGLALTTFALGVPHDLIRTWRDGPLLVRNEFLHQISWAGFASFFSDTTSGTYQPLAQLSYWIDVPWFGSRALFLHAVNLALWCVALVVLLRALRAWGLPLVAAVVGTLVVGVHPVQVELVSWASGRGELLALLFASAALWMHVDAADLRGKRAWATRLFIVAAVLSSPNAVALPALLVAGDVFLRKISLKPAIVAQLPMLGVVAAAAFVTANSPPVADSLMRESAGASLVAATFTHAVETLFWPAHVSPVYRVGHIAELGWAVWSMPLVLVACGVIAWLKKWHQAGFVLAGFVVMMLPVANIWLMPWQWQDRYLSLPLLAVGFGVALAVAKFPRTDRSSQWPRGWVVAVGVLLVLALSTRTALYVQAWQSDASLWRYAVANQPNAFYGWYNLGLYRRDRGDFEGAIRAFTKSTELEPRQRLGFAGLMSALALRDEARVGLRRSQALRLAQLYSEKLDDLDTLHDLAERMLELGYRDAAYLPLSQWLDANPMDDDRLERAAQVRVRLHDKPLALFYVSRMHRAPVPPELQALLRPQTR